MALIERLFRNPGGSTVTFGPPGEPPEAVYEFKPLIEGGPHVCVVDNPDHVDRFLLEIPEGYREVTDEEAGASDVPPVDGAPDYESMDPQSLLAAYKAAYGKPPHPKALRETIVMKLREADAARVERAVAKLEAAAPQSEGLTPAAPAQPALETPPAA